MNDRYDASAEEPTEPALAELVRAATDARVQDATLTAVAGADHPEAGPQAGELWRARPPDGGPATLLWVRTLMPGGAVVVPVTLDVELADESTLIVPAEQSPLGLPLALQKGIETTVDPDVLHDRLGTVDLATESEWDRGPSVVSLLDPRVEYHAALADNMAALASGLGPEVDSAGEADWWPPGLRSDQAELLIAVHGALAASHPGARVSPTPVSAAASEVVRPVAQVSELDAFVLVGFVDPEVEGSAFLDAARAVLHGDQLLNAVCLVEPTDPFMAVVIDRHDVVAAIETPSGELRPPRQSRGPVAVGEALTKFLDSAITPFGRLASTFVDAEAVDAHLLAVDVSAEAVRAVAASAGGFKVEGKRPGYERVTAHQAAISQLVEDALNDADIDVASILEGDE